MLQYFYNIIYNITKFSNGLITNNNTINTVFQYFWNNIYRLKFSIQYLTLIHLKNTNFMDFAKKCDLKFVLTGNCITLASKNLNLKSQTS